jgi:threonine dehydratase
VAATSLVDLDAIRAAAHGLEGVAHRTPDVTSRTLDARVGASVVLKAENLQRTGSFKFRGAYTTVRSLSPDERRRGVATVSSGNHAQALALAARLHDVPATILMPEDSPPAKLVATRAYGAEVIRFDRYSEDREALLAALVADRGLVPAHPYDDPRVMAGQGTAALELIEDAGPLDVLLVCVGGGGLIAGCATAAKALLEGVRVIGVEPAVGDDTKRSLEAGRRVRVPVGRTIADGQQIDIPGEHTFEVVRRLVDDVLLVSDDEIVATMRFLFERLKLVVEPSGASALAALMSGRIDVRGQRVGVTLSGGNVAADRFAALMA